jgi:hypothetical protein
MNGWKVTSGIDTSIAPRVQNGHVNAGPFAFHRASPLQFQSHQDR